MDKFDIGDRIFDYDYEKYGTVTDVNYPVIFVKWDDGSESDFTPTEETFKLQSKVSP